jgi:hypothetical protein
MDNGTDREAFDVSDLLDHGVYFQEPRTLLISLDEGTTKDIVLILGDHYCMWPAATFKAWANRLLRQL